MSHKEVGDATTTSGMRNGAKRDPTITLIQRGADGREKSSERPEGRGSQGRGFTKPFSVSQSARDPDQHFAVSHFPPMDLRVQKTTGFEVRTK